MPGLRPDAITVLVATGLHRPNEGQELEELVGSSWVMETVRVENHFARDDAAHVDLGATPTRGTPVRLDRRFVEADLRIATGLVEPHFMAGYSGGRKVIAPGVAHKDTITTFHSARFMAHPKAENCILEGNPLHEEQLEIVRMLGGALALNTVIDEERRLSFVNFGEIGASHMAAVRHVEDYVRVPVAGRFQTVLTSAAGYPLDKTYYQTVKGMVAPMDIVAPGGDLIIVSECSEGMGSAEFVDAQRRLVEGGAERFMDEIARQALRRHRRVADADAAEADGRRQGPSLHRRPAGGAARADRGPHGRIGSRCGARQRREVGRAPRRRDPRGPVCGARASSRRLEPAHGRRPTSTSIRWAASPATCFWAPRSMPGRSSPRAPSRRCARPACPRTGRSGISRTATAC